MERHVFSDLAEVADSISGTLSAIGATPGRYDLDRLCDLISRWDAHGWSYDADALIEAAGRCLR